MIIRIFHDNYYDYDNHNTVSLCWRLNLKSSVSLGNVQAQIGVMPTKACQDLVSQNDWCWWFHHFTSVECQSLLNSRENAPESMFWTNPSWVSKQTICTNWKNVAKDPFSYGTFQNLMVWDSAGIGFVWSCKSTRRVYPQLSHFKISFQKKIVIWCHLMQKFKQKTQENPNILRRPRIIQDLSLSPHENNNWNTRIRKLKASKPFQNILKHDVFNFFNPCDYNPIVGFGGREFGANWDSRRNGSLMQVHLGNREVSSEFEFEETSPPICPHT